MGILNLAFLIIIGFLIGFIIAGAIIPWVIICTAGLLFALMDYYLH
jgi:hypothetical protein